MEQGSSQETHTPECEMSTECDVGKLIEDLVTAQWQVKDAVKDVDSQWDYWKLFNDIVDLLACTNEGGESA